MNPALKARLDALRKKAAPVKPKAPVQHKVAAPRKVAPENPKPTKQAAVRAAHTSVVLGGSRGGGKTAEQKHAMAFITAKLDTPVADKMGGAATKPLLRETFEHPPKPTIPLIKPTIENAVLLVQEAGIAYASLFTTRMGVHDTRIGVADAFALLDKLEEKGVIGPAENLELGWSSYRKVYNLKPGGVK